MIDANSFTLFKRVDGSNPLEFEQLDTNWQRIETAIKYLLAANWQQDYEGVSAGELEVVHDFGLLPKSVTVWQKVNADRWIPLATPDVSYLDNSLTSKLYINFSEGPGTIKVIVKF